MKDSEAKQIVMAIDGVAAYLETIRNLVLNSIDEEKLESVTPSKANAKEILEMIPNEKCVHERSLELNTLGGTSLMCEDCGEVY